jgi:hypothetical protein
MKISMLFRILFYAFVATTLAVSASAQTALGRIKAAKVEGSVTKVRADGSTAPLKEGEMLVETDSILTGKGGSVVLVFANASSVKLGSETRMAIEEFRMDPLADDLKPAEQKAEPSVSKTTLNLAYGEMVGDVKKLNTSSSYSIKTPVGAAGIRGTIFRIVFRPSSDGKAFFTVSTAEGKVVMEGVTPGEVPVDAGKEVVVEIDTDNPSNPNIVTQDIPAATQAVITEAAKAIAEAIKEVVIPSGNANPPPPPPPPPEDETNEQPDDPTPQA